jgi:hypothetical protein
MTDVDLAWEEFLDTTMEFDYKNEDNESTRFNPNEIPKATDIYISTKTIIGYVNTSLNLFDIFWQIPILFYHEPKEGIIKKQIKLNSTSKEELEKNQENYKNLEYYEEQIINHIENPTGKIKYKDTRKITIGTSKKDILSYRSRKKGAFYNCFVVILRIKDENIFKEIHIKVFNTGKLEIPGIQKDHLLEKSLGVLINILQDITKNNELKYIKESEDTVLINSNFNCGYFIDREKLFNILRFNYGINSCYDPCSYPGIQCEFYYDKTKEYNSGKQESKKEKKLEKNPNILRISFMIFRTGSCLIVGKCNEQILLYIYNFIKDLLIKEFSNIATSILTVKPIEKNKKVKKKIIYLEKS